MRKAWRYNAVRWPVIEAERLKYGAEVPVVRLSSDREIEDFLDGVESDSFRETDIQDS